MTQSRPGRRPPQVVLQPAGVVTVDANDPHGARRRTWRERARTSVPRGVLLGVGDRVLEVEHDRVGAEGADLLSLRGWLPGAKRRPAVSTPARPSHRASRRIFYFLCRTWLRRATHRRRPSWPSRCCGTGSGPARSSPAAPAPQPPYRRAGNEPDADPRGAASPPGRRVGRPTGRTRASSSPSFRAGDGRGDPPALPARAARRRARRPELTRRAARAGAAARALPRRGRVRPGHRIVARQRGLALGALRGRRLAAPHRVHPPALGRVPLAHDVGAAGPHRAVGDRARGDHGGHRGRGRRPQPSGCRAHNERRAALDRLELEHRASNGSRDGADRARPRPFAGIWHRRGSAAASCARSSSRSLPRADRALRRRRPFVHHGLRRRRRSSRPGGG